MNIAIKNMKLKSAPGIDQTDYNVISSLPCEYLNLLLKIYNNILFEGSFPNQWKHSLIVLIPKPDDGSFRPISLLPCFLKIMEKMIYNRIQWHAESQYIIPDNQLGFRPDRSCIDSLVILSCGIHNGFINNSSTICAFLDIKGAFDNVILNILIQDLENIGIPTRVKMFILNLISSRSLYFMVDGNKTGPFSSHKGTQGSTLSPLLFDIYLRDIIKHLHYDSHILLYADDITIYSTSSNPLEAFLSVQTSLDRISGFLKNRGLDFSPEKSQWMTFTRVKTIPCLPSLKIYGSPVSKATSVKFLEIILDSKMLGREHLRYLIRKGSIIVDIFSSLAGTWWSSHLLLNLYRSIFRGSIEYGCQIFRFNLNKSIFAKLGRLQYRAIRIAMGYQISTPINVMLFESKEVPLKLRFISLMRKFFTKNLARNPVIENLEMLKVTSFSRKARINLLRSFPIQTIHFHILLP